jgi:hypothetical protein
MVVRAEEREGPCARWSRRGSRGRGPRERKSGWRRERREILGKWNEREAKEEVFILSEGMKKPLERL